MVSFDVNYLAVLVSTIVSMAIGAFWYSPAGFGKKWMELMNITKANIDKAKQKGMTKSYITAFIALFILNFVLANIIMTAQAISWFEGLQVGLVMWLGFIATVMIGSILWESKPVKLYLINVLHYAVVLAIAGAILAAWP